MIDPNSFPDDWQPLDEAKQKEIIVYTSNGCSRQTSAGIVGCTIDDIRRTALVDANFQAELNKAEGRHEFTALHSITKAAAEGKAQWRASAWLLERCYTNRYGRRGATTLTRDQCEELVGLLGDIVNSYVDNPADREEVRLALLSVVTQIFAPKKGRGHAA